MRTVQLINSICLLALSACAHTPDSSPVKTEKFRFIFREIGKKTPDDKALVGQMQRGHIDNFKRLFAEQKLIVAGPLQDPSTLKRGIVIVNPVVGAAGCYGVRRKLCRQFEWQIKPARRTQHVVLGVAAF